MRVLLLAGLLFSSVAWGAPSAAEVERALGGYERAPSAEDVKRLGPGADQVLIAAANDPRTSRLRRARAIGALGSRPAPARTRSCARSSPRRGGRTCSARTCST